MRRLQGRWGCPDAIKMADYTSVSLNIRILLTANHVKIITIFYGFHAYPIKLGAAIIPDSNTLSPGKCSLADLCVCMHAGIVII